MSTDRWDDHDLREAFAALRKEDRRHAPSYEGLRRGIDPRAPSRRRLRVVWGTSWTPFIGIAEGGSGNISAVAPGVAEALITTVAGLVVAIPAVMAYNILVSRLGLFAGELEGFAQEIIGALAREGRL